MSTIAYCSLLEKSGMSELQLIEDGTVIYENQKKDAKRTTYKVAEIIKKLADTDSERPLILARPTEASTAFDGHEEDEALDLRHISYNGFYSIECVGMRKEDDGTPEAGRPVPGKIFEIGPQYCKKCPFHME